MSDLRMPTAAAQPARTNGSLKRRRGRGSRVLTDLHVVMTVWGEPYTGLFLDLALPNQLAPGNLPAIRDLPGAEYRIFSTAESARTIASHPSFARLRDVVPTTIVVLDGLSGESPQKYASMNDCHRRAVVDARAAGAAMVFLLPDFVLSDGALAELRRLAEVGMDAVLATAPPLWLPTAMPALQAGIVGEGEPTLPLSGRELVALALEHLHPITRAGFVHEAVFTTSTSILLWRVGRHGVLVRGFHLHPLLVWPRRDAMPEVTVDHRDYIRQTCPDPRRIHVIADSDRLAVFEISGARDTQMREGFDARVTANWALEACDDLHRQLIRRRIRLHVDDVDASWRPVERESDAAIRRIRFHLRTLPAQAAAARIARRLPTVPRARIDKLRRRLAKRFWKRLKRVRKGIERRATVAYRRGPRRVGRAAAHRLHKRDRRGR